jgi:DNA primase
LDPCDLRLQHGDEAVRALIERRVPLFEFAIKSTLAGYDLESAEGRVAALRDAAPVVAKIRDTALRPEYTRRLAGWLGMDVETVARAVTPGASGSGVVAPAAPAPMPRAQSGPRRDPSLIVEREALKCALQEPAAVAQWYESIEESAFTHPSARAVHAAIASAGYPSADVTGLAWIDAVLESAADDNVRRQVRELTVEPLPAEIGQDGRYAIGVISRLLELDAGRRIEDLRGRLQRIDPGTQADEYQKCFADLLALEDYKRSLRQESLGGVT